MNENVSFVQGERFGHIKMQLGVIHKLQHKWKVVGGGGRWKLHYFPYVPNLLYKYQRAQM